MDAAAEQSWQQGMVSNSSMSLNFDQESWDDSVILDIFDEAIRSHRTKNGTKKKAKAKPPVAVHSGPPTHNGKQAMATTTSSSSSQQGRKKVEFTSTAKGGGQQWPVADVEQNYAQHDHIPTASPSYPPSSGAAAYGTYHPQPDVPIHNQLDDAFNSMLMAWYQSGYATGRYQALLEISNQQQQQPQYPHHHQQQQQQQPQPQPQSHNSGPYQQQQEEQYQQQHQHHATNSSTSTTDNDDTHSSIPTTAILGAAATSLASASSPLVEESTSSPPPSLPASRKTNQLPDHSDDAIHDT